VALGVQQNVVQLQVPGGRGRGRGGEEEERRRRRKNQTIKC